MSAPHMQYPGLGLALRHWPARPDRAWAFRPERPVFSFNRAERACFFPLGSHPNAPGSDSVLLPVREIAMMAIMDRLTDKPEWQRKVFDAEIVSKWKAEAMAVPDSEWKDVASVPEQYLYGPGIMSEKAFEYCIKELQSKARHYEKTRLIPTLDASAAVIKSDSLVSDELRGLLRDAFTRLQVDQAVEPDWHPRSGDMVQDIVHPSLYPLVYGQSKVFPTEVVGVTVAINRWAGKGSTIARPEPSACGHQSGFLNHVTLGSGEIPDNYWSEKYQWLPSNVAFQDDGSVRLTSYINNLHPTRYTEIYKTVEKLIETAIPAWDHCLMHGADWPPSGPGRKGSRFSIPSGADDECRENWSPSDPQDVADADVDLSSDSEEEDEEDEVDEEYRQGRLNERKWKKLRMPVLREPSTYQEVEYGPCAKTDATTTENSSKARAAPQKAKKHTGGLFQQFKSSGLQVIVKMASIELTPDKPAFPAGGWHVEGLMNEKICATALYYLDSENITESRLAFRMQTLYDQDELQQVTGQDSYSWLEHEYGTSLGASGSAAAGSCVQTYGSVETREGRLLAFPNIFQHRVCPFKLADPAKPGHRRFIALWLVDPHCRIISTANVPPQQRDWWVDSIFGKSEESRKAAAEKLPAEVLRLLKEQGIPLPDVEAAEETTLPPEIIQMIRDQLSLGTLSMEEAKEHRLVLMDERSSHQRVAEGEWRRTEYNFCEH